jgi:hypothetical protein
MRLPKILFWSLLTYVVLMLAYCVALGLLHR